MADTPLYDPSVCDAPLEDFRIDATLPSDWGDHVIKATFLDQPSDEQVEQFKRIVLAFSYAKPSVFRRVKNWLLGEA